MSAALARFEQGAYAVRAEGQALNADRLDALCEAALAKVWGDAVTDELGSGKLMVLTDVPYVERDWDTAAAAQIEVATPPELRELTFAAGSMGPKIEAACRFVERTGGEAVIGSLAELDAIATGLAGTRIVAGSPLSVP